MPLATKLATRTVKRKATKGAKNAVGLDTGRKKPKKKKKRKLL